MTSNFKILIIDELDSSIHRLLSEQHLTADYQPNITKDEVLNTIESYACIIVRSKMQLDKTFFDKAISLKLIARAGAGIDNIDLEEANKHNVTVVHAAEGNANALAEHTLALLLNIMNNVTASSIEVSNFQWNREANRGYELAGKTVGVIGYGYMGKAFAQKVKALGCKVICYDKYLTNYSDNIVEEVTLQKLFDQSEIVSLHIPLTKENKHFVNQTFFDSFVNNIWFINAARGEVVETSALINALDSGKVRAAGLDVIENEKLSTLTTIQQNDFENLLARKNVIITPHIGGWSFESYQKINQVLIEKIVKYLKVGLTKENE